MGVLATLFTARTLNTGTLIAVLVAKADSIEAQLDGKPDIRFIKLVDFDISGGTDPFQIRVFCNEAFQVKSVFATVRGGRLDIAYNDVVALGNIFGETFAPPFGWSIRHTDFDPPSGAPSTRGYELLSQLQVEKPVGIAVGGSLDILGVAAGEGERIWVGAVLNTAQDSANICQIVIVDF